MPFTYSFFPILPLLQPFAGSLSSALRKYLYPKRTGAINRKTRDSSGERPLQFGISGKD
jgi:hypothetical protein